MNRRATQVGTFEVCVLTHVALRMLIMLVLAVNCIFWPIETLNWLFRHYYILASKLHKNMGTCYTAELPFYLFPVLCYLFPVFVFTTHFTAMCTPYLFNGVRRSTFDAGLVTQFGVFSVQYYSIGKIILQRT